MQLETQTEAQKQNLPLEGQDTELAQLHVIRTETVLSKLPIHNLAKKGRVNIEITRQGPNGEIELKWEVSYSERYGQARQLAYKLDTIVVDRVIEEVGKPLPDRLRLGSLRDLADQLGLGHDIAKLKRAFHQNASTYITAKFKYKANDGTEKKLEAGFTRYSVIFTGQKFSDGTRANAVYLTLNPDYREVLNNAPVRPLDLGYKKELPPAAQRFYEIISYQIFAALKYNQPTARLRYSDYCTFSGQQRYFTRAQVQKQMYKIHVIHQDSGYLTNVRYEPTTDAPGNPDWMMFYVPGPKARAEYVTFTGKKLRPTTEAQLRIGESAPHQRRPRQKPLPLQPTVDESQLTALTSRGVSEPAARKVLSDLPADFRVLDTLEYGDQQIMQQRGKITNPPGFYISLLRDRITPPPTFESSATKAARQRAELAQQQVRAEAEARRQAEEDAAAQLMEAQLDQLKAADPTRYAELYRQAKADLIQLYPKMAEIFRSHPNAHALHESSIRAGMKRLLTENPHYATSEPARQSDPLAVSERAGESAPQPAPVITLADFYENLQTVLVTPQLAAPQPLPPAATQPENDQHS
jgi:hypothetical protein